MRGAAGSSDCGADMAANHSGSVRSALAWAMPELPEVETIRRGLVPVLVGRRLVEVAQRRPDLRWPLPARFSERLRGQKVEGIDRRGKYLLIRLDGDEVWLTHLGMSGRFCIEPNGAQASLGAHDHLVI